MSKIKILHTSDWHLGKKLYKQSRLEEMVSYLNFTKKMVEENAITHLLISGDVFDSPNPETTAYKLFFEFLHCIKCDVYIISGNHDNGKFLEAPLPFLKDYQIQIIGSLRSDPMKHSFKLRFPENSEKFVNLTLLPFFRSTELLIWAGEQGLVFDKTISFEEKINLSLESFFDHTPKGGEYSILMLHHLLGSFYSEGTEQTVQGSGINSIDVKLLKDHFDYVALGHIHKSQNARTSGPVAFYPGSPIPMRFSEDSKKFVNILEISENGTVDIQKVVLPIFRELKRIKVNDTNFQEKIEKDFEQSSSRVSLFEAWYEVSVEIARPKLGLIDQIRDLFSKHQKRLLNVKLELAAGSDESSKTRELLNFDSLPTPTKLFKSYFSEKFGEAELSEKLCTQFETLISEIQDGESL